MCGGNICQTPEEKLSDCYNYHRHDAKKLIKTRKEVCKGKRKEKSQEKQQLERQQGVGEPPSPHGPSDRLLSANKKIEIGV